MISHPTLLSFPGTPESPPSHQVENSPKKACPRLAQESHPPARINPEPQKRALCPPLSSKALGFSGKELASASGSNADSEAVMPGELGTFLALSLLFSKWPPLFHSRGWTDGGAATVYHGHPKSSSGSRGLPYPPQAGKENGSGGPQSPKG